MGNLLAITLEKWNEAFVKEDVEIADKFLLYDREYGFHIERMSGFYKQRSRRAVDFLQRFERHIDVQADTDDDTKQI